MNIARKLEQLYKNPRIKAATDIIQARLLAVAIMLKDSLKEQEREVILEEWERITFRIFGLFRKDSRTKVGEYTRLSHLMLSTSISKGEIIDWIDWVGSDYPINEAIKELQGKEWYPGWEEDLRYFFYHYEEYLAAKQGGKVSKEIWEQIWLSSPSTTIEHIHPQNPSSAWHGKLDEERIREKNMFIAWVT